MADTVKGHGRIVTVMAVACTPPLLLQGLDYIDMTGCPAAADKYAKALAKLLEALEDARAGKVRYRAWFANLRPIDFHGHVREKADGFHGRHWLSQDIARWRDSGATQSLLILGDARNNYRATGAQTLKRLVARARHAYWLNPEPQAYWGSGDSATGAYEELIEMVEVRNAVQLEEFVQRLLPT